MKEKVDIAVSGYSTRMGNGDYVHYILLDMDRTYCPPIRITVDEEKKNQIEHLLGITFTKTDSDAYKQG